MNERQINQIVERVVQRLEKDLAPAASGGGSQVALKTTRQGHIVPGRTRVETTKVDRVEHNPHSIRGDGNTVELEREMSNLAENTLMYNTATRLVANKFNLLKSVIKGGS